MSESQAVSHKTSVEQILAATQLNLHPDSFVLVGLPPSVRPQLEADLLALTATFFQYTVEPDVLTVLLPGLDWANLAPRYPAAQVEGPLRLFSFSVAMAWDVVGFLASVTGLLAANGIPLGAVCGYYRDHLFIAEAYAARAEAALTTELARCRKLPQ